MRNLISEPQTRRPKYRDSFSIEGIQAGLKTRLFGKGPIYFYETIESTNVEAKRLAGAGLPEGALILAESQSRGKGRMERRWASPKGGGLYLSVVLRPDIMPQEVQKLTFVAAVALACTLRELDVQPQIKWPNDILINGRKVAGILMELTGGFESVDFVILGIGLNLSRSMKEFPRSIQNQAASVNMAAGRSIDRREIIQVLLLQLEVWYELFLRGSFESILEVWRRFADMLGARVRVILSEGSMEGTAEDVASDGSLMVRDDKGSIHRVIVGDVVRCRPV